MNVDCNFLVKMFDFEFQKKWNIFILIVLAWNNSNSEAKTHKVDQWKHIGNVVAK